jgi:soluble lytic murein transglycosylase-like protein
MSVSALGTSAAAGLAGASAAAERMQQLQTLIAQVERGPAGFAAALDAAQANQASAPSANAGGGTATAAASTGSSIATPGATGASAEPTAGGAALADASYIPQALGSTGTGTAAATPSALTSTAAANPYGPLIEQAAARNGVEPSVLYGLIQQESGFDPSATSSAGALGLTQLMPGTASSLGVTEPLNPAQSIEGGARYLGQLLRQFSGNTADALAAYNAGPGAVQRYGGVPPYPETQQYVSKVLANAAAYSSSSPTAAAATVTSEAVA